MRRTFCTFFYIYPYNDYFQSSLIPSFRLELSSGITSFLVRQVCWQQILSLCFSENIHLWSIVLLTDFFLWAFCVIPLSSGLHCFRWQSHLVIVLFQCTWWVISPLLLSRLLFSLTFSSLIMIYWGVDLFVFIIIWLIELLGFGTLMFYVRPGKLLAIICSSAFLVFVSHSSPSGVPVPVCLYTLYCTTCL